jgi:DNA topoisomerase-1
VDTLAAATKIQGFLDSEWRVVASGGGVFRDFPRSDVFNQVERLPSSFVLTSLGQTVVDKLKPLTEKAEAVYLGLGYDRIGEWTAWQLKEILGLESPFRVDLVEITPEGVKKALDRSRFLRVSLATAEEAYRTAERLCEVASLASQALTGQYVGAGLSLTAVLETLIDKEKASNLSNFERSYGVELIFSPENQKKLSWRAYWNPKNWLNKGETFFQNQKIAERVAELNRFKVASYKEGAFYVKSLPPLSTKTLFRTASDILSFESVKTRSLALGLYEQGHVTYPLAANKTLTPNVLDKIRELATNYGWPIEPSPRVWPSYDYEPDYLECVRPVNLSLEVAGDSDEQKKLYKLIRLRTLASQMMDALYDETQVVLWSVLDGKKVFFEAKKRRIKKPGFKSLYNDEPRHKVNYDEDLNNPIPKLIVESDLITKASNVYAKSKSTDHLTEIKLLKETLKTTGPFLEEFSSLTKDLINWGYASVNVYGHIQSEPRGQKVLELIRHNFPCLTNQGSKGFRELLDRVTKGEVDWVTAVVHFSQTLQKDLAKFHGPTVKCPECGEDLLRVVGRQDQLITATWVCPNNECGVTYADEAGSLGQKKELEAPYRRACPYCGRPLALFKGVKSWEPKEFWACNVKFNCGARFYNDHGKLGQAFFRLAPAKVTCPDCGSPIIGHVEIKDGVEIPRFYCQNRRECGLRFKNNHGVPGDRLFLPNKNFPCPECGQPLTHCHGKTKKGSYNYWICQETNGCQLRYKDEDNAPGEKMSSVIHTEKICPDCHSHLILIKIQKHGQDHSFWSCHDRTNCGARFTNKNGEIGDRVFSVALTRYFCKECQTRLELRKGFKFGKPFVTWVCSNKQCQERYENNDGAPGDSLPKVTKTDRKCPVCQGRLALIVKHGLLGYSHWSCGNNDCRATFSDIDGRVGERLELTKSSQKARSGQQKGEKTEFLCPYCRSPLVRVRGISKKRNNKFDFFSCSNQHCERTFNTVNDQPDFPTVPGAEKIIEALTQTTEPSPPQSPEVA